jgi:hypothetical protein
MRENNEQSAGVYRQPATQNPTHLLMAGFGDALGGQSRMALVQNLLYVLT